MTDARVEGVALFPAATPRRENGTVSLTQEGDFDTVNIVDSRIRHVSAREQVASGALPGGIGPVLTAVRYRLLGTLLLGCLIGEACPPIGLGAADVYFEAFDAGNVSLGTIGPDYLGDGAANGGTAEDRFYGATNAGGISKIVIWIPDSNDW